MEEVKPVNLPFTPLDLVGNYQTAYKTPDQSGVDAYQESLNKIQQMSATQSTAVPQYTGEELGISSSSAKRFPVMYPGRDNEEIYAQSQGTWEKAYNGVAKMAGLATSTFIQGTVGTIYGAMETAKTGKFSSFYNNDLNKSLNEWTNSLEDTNAHYRTQRERDGSWWEPSNLFTANFLFDNIVKNIGFSLGAMAGGVAWGAALKAVGLTSKLVGAGADMAAKADAAIGEATTLPKAERLGSILGKLEGLTSKGLMNADRAIVAATGSIGEAGIEALNNSQQFRENEIAEFKRTHGHAPSQEDLNIIDEHAASVGNWSMGLNTALLTATQYIQLPKVLGSTYKGEKQLANNITLQEGKYVSTLPTEGFGKYLYKTKNIGSLFFEGSEAFEEGAQFAIQTGTQNYYDKRYKGKEASILDDGILKGVREALTTDEGLLNVFTGGFSGGLMTSGISTLGRTGKISERGITGYGGEQAILRDETIKAFNNTLLRDKLKSVYENVKASEVIQQEREAAIRRGDILESKDLEFDYAHSFVSSRLKFNAKEAIDNEINNLKTEAFTNEGFIKLQQDGIAASTDTRESFIKRLDNLQQHANYANELYEAAKVKYIGKKDEEGKLLYSDDVIDKMVYAGAKVMDYTRRIPELASNLSKQGIDTLSIANEINKGELSEETVKNTIAQIKQLGGINEDDLITDLRDFVELSLRKKQFISEYNDIKNNPLKYKEEQSNLKTPTEQPSTITVTDKEGEREVEVGEEYYLGSIEYTDDKGVRQKRFPRLTILGENEDGTIKIKEASGRVRDIDKKELESYKLGKVADVHKSENSSFYFRNVIKFPETKVFWNTGKDKAGKVEGTLQYDGKNDKLYFVYDQKGKTKYKEIGIDQFTPKEGYKEGVFSFDRTLSAEDNIDINNRKTSGKTQRDIEARRGDKLRILNNLYQEIVTKSGKVNELLAKKRIEFENISKELSELEEKIFAEEETFDKRFKKPTFKKALKESLNAAERLQKTKDELEFQILELEEQKENLDREKEEILPYIEDMAQNIDELPAGNQEFLEELREQKSLLEDAISSTKEQLSSLQSLADKVKATLDSAIDFVADLINKFKEKYPKTPLAIVANEWIDFLQANPNFLKRKPDYKSDLKQLEDLVAQVEDLDITPSERHLKELNENINELKETLKNSEAQLASINKVLGKFEEIAQRNKEIREQEILLEKDKALQADLLGTHIERTETVINEKETFDPIPKKSLFDVVRSTTASTFLNKPHQKRANRFGFNLPKFGKKEFKGIIVTSKTEDSILKGLTKFLLFDNPDTDQTSLEVETPHLKRRIKYNVDDVIVLVVTDKNGNLVDENGETLSGELSDKEKLDKAIFQVFPVDLNAEYYNPDTNQWELQSMFRKDENEANTKALEQQFENWKKEQLSKTELGIPQNIDASFGIPEYSTKITEVIVNGKPQQKESVDYTARVSAKEAGLIDDETLNTNVILDIPTTNDNVTEGKMTLRNALGRVFLRLPNQGLVKLNNRKFNKKEAETIFVVIEQLCKNLYSKHTKNLSKDEIYELDKKNKELTNWLDSVIQWGIPKDVSTGKRKEAKFNSIWFEGGKLNISGKGTQFDFTPSGLLANKNTITTLLQGMYHDTSVRFLRDTNWNNTYKEITGIDEKGNPTFKTWKNYQTYLLYSEGRTKDEIPLTTIIRPLQDEEDVNRKGIYFSLSDSEYTLPTKKEVVEEKMPILEDVKFPSEFASEEQKNKSLKLQEQFKKLQELFKCI